MSLTDGTGATEFLRELVKNYLYLMHEKDGLENVILTEQDLTVKDQEEDGFGRYYNPDERGTRKKKNHAYQIRRESKEYEELQNWRDDCLSKRTSGSIKKTWRIHVCIFDGSDDLCDS